MEVFKKLAEVQAVIEQPKFDSVNPHFKSKFASLSECNRVVMEAIRKVGGCAVYQKSQVVGDGHAMVSTVFCADGDMVELSHVPYFIDPNPQKQGSGITYARRYSLCSAFCLVADEDDDGNAASEKPRQKPQNAPRRAKAAKAAPEGGKAATKADMDEFSRLTGIMQTLMGGVDASDVYKRLGDIYGTTAEGKLDVAKMPEMLSYMRMCADAGVLLESA